MAFFSSGWENVHGIEPLTRGERWALSMVFMLDHKTTGLLPKPTAPPIGRPPPSRADSDGKAEADGEAEAEAADRPVAPRYPLLPHAPPGGGLRLGPVDTGKMFRQLCVQPADKSMYPLCRASWAGLMSGPEVLI